MRIARCVPFAAFFANSFDAHISQCSLSSASAKRYSASAFSSGDWRTGVSPHHALVCDDARGRVTDGADSPVAAGWADRAMAVAL